MYIELIYLIPIFLCWGSFLNVLSIRLISGASLLTRSRCPRCKNLIAWYDNIPLLSFFLLRTRCRSCTHPISYLYPFIEALTAILMTVLYVTSPSYEYFVGYFIFFSALIVTIRSDLETMLISRIMTLGLVPVGIMASFFDFIPLYPLNSILGACIGYGFLWLVAYTFKKATGKDGMGEGDFDLLACIGAFTGIAGVWASLMIGSLFGSFIGGTYLYVTRQWKHDVRIPFGPFLAAGAIMFVLFYEQIMRILIIG